MGDLYERVSLIEIFITVLVMVVGIVGVGELYYSEPIEGVRVLWHQLVIYDTKSGLWT